MAGQIEKLLSNVKFEDLCSVPLSVTEQVDLRNLIFKMKPRRLKQVLTIIQRVEPNHVHISQEGINVDVKKLSLYTQRYLQKFVVNASQNPCPSRKAPPDPEDEKEDPAPRQVFTGITMQSGIKLDHDHRDEPKPKVGATEKAKPKRKSPYQLEIDEYVDGIRKELGNASENYWKNLTNELKNGKLTRVFRLLGEVVTRTKALVPAKAHEKIDDLIDVGLLQNAAQNGAMDGAMFLGMFDSIHSTLRSLHPPALDVMWDAWRESIVEKCQTGTATWHELLPAMINQFLMKLDRLEEMIAKLRRQAGLPDQPINATT